jgi:hypothetical protein
MSKTHLDEDYPLRAVLAAEWGVSERTVYNYELEPNGLPSLKLGGKARYPRREAYEWLQARAPGAGQRGPIRARELLFFTVAWRGRLLPDRLVDLRAKRRSPDCAQIEASQNGGSAA